MRGSYTANFALAYELGHCRFRVSESTQQLARVYKSISLNNDGRSTGLWSEVRMQTGDAWRCVVRECGTARAEVCRIRRDAKRDDTDNV